MKATSRDSRSTIVGILVIADRPLAAAQLIALAAPFGLSASNVKSHLSRMVAEGELVRAGTTRKTTYQPSPEHGPIVQSIHERIAPERAAPWDSSWITLVVGPLASRSEREQIRAVLWLDGYRPLAPGTMVRPAWPMPWAEIQARAYSDLTQGICLHGRFLKFRDSIDELYDLDRLDAAALRLAARLERHGQSHGSPRGITPRQAFRERLRCGAEVVRLLTLDPRLPPELWGARRGLTTLADAYTRFEELLSEPSSDFVRSVVEEPQRSAN